MTNQTTATPTTRTGGCLCGAVRFTVTAEPLVVRTCWCRVCQALGAGSATVNAGFPSEAVTITGQTTDYISTADSGTTMHRRFCPICGTALFSQAETRRHQIYIRVGAMDQREGLAPQITIWTEAAPAWACINPDIPKATRQVPPTP
jgi:hypothetical protein